MQVESTKYAYNLYILILHKHKYLLDIDLNDLEWSVTVLCILTVTQSQLNIVSSWQWELLAEPRWLLKEQHWSSR